MNKGILSAPRGSGGTPDRPYATADQCADAVSASSVLSPFRLIDARSSYATILPSSGATTSGGSVTWNAAGSAFGPFWMWIASGTTGGGQAYAYTSTQNNGPCAWSRGLTGGNAWGKRRALFTRVMRFYSATSANSFMRITFGKAWVFTFGRLSAAGFGIEVLGARIWLVSHNGSAATATDTGVDFANAAAFDFLIDSNGAGTVNLFANGVLIGTNNGGPTTTTSGSTLLTYEVGNGGDAAGNSFHFSPSIVLWS